MWGDTSGSWGLSGGEQRCRAGAELADDVGRGADVVDLADA